MQMTLQEAKKAEAEAKQRASALVELTRHSSKERGGLSKDLESARKLAADTGVQLCMQCFTSTVLLLQSCFRSCMRRAGAGPDVSSCQPAELTSEWTCIGVWLRTAEGIVNREACTYASSHLTASK